MTDHRTHYIGELSGCNLNFVLICFDETDEAKAFTSQYSSTLDSLLSYKTITD
ncbi:MAG: hypothetical protein AB8A32_10020 [Prochlorococcus sp.]